MRYSRIIASVIFGVILVTSVLVQAKHFPPRGETWQKMDTKKAGFKTKELQEVVKFAQDNEYSGSKDLRIAILKGFAHEPYHDVLGPTKKRGGPAGMIIKDGYVVAQWGNIKRVDMTFSVTKSYLSTVAGVAVDQGLINVDDKVIDYVWDKTFDGEHNAKITWDHLLTQSSDWSGSMFGSPDWTDRPPREGGVDDWKNRELHSAWSRC
jgi:CubicO group peptidase (beta-lactamase class C family)